MKKVLLLSFVFLTTISTNVQAQNFLGYRQSNYAGVVGGDLNPAAIADSRFRVDVTLAGVGFQGYNNWAYMNAHRMPYWWKGTFTDDYTDENGVVTDNQLDEFWNPNYLDSTHADYIPGAPGWGDIIHRDSGDFWFNQGVGNFFEYPNASKKARAAYLAAEVDILNFMVSITPKMAISAGIKSRTFLNIDHVNPDLITLAMNGLEYPDLWDVDLDDQLLNMSFNSWLEYNVGFASVLYDKEDHFIKAGLKLKLTQGVGSFYLYTDNVDYSVFNDDTLLQIQGDFNYGYSENIDKHFDASSSSYIGGSGVDADGNPDGSIAFKDIFDRESRFGFGADIGVEYEYRPKWKDFKYDMDGETNLWRKDKNKYLLKFSLALNDIGGMKYLKSNNSRNFSVNMNVTNTQQAEMLSLFQFSEDTDGLESFNQNLDSLVQGLPWYHYGTQTSNPNIQNAAEYIDDDEAFYMNLPTHMNIGVDFNIYRDFYLNLNGFIGFQMNKNAHKVRYPTSITLTPRYDFAWAGVSFPFSYNPVMGTRIGFGLRAGPIILGTSDLKFFFAHGKNVKVRGLDIYAALRVPILYQHPKDQDEDKVSDKLDICIETPGVWEFKGCPDTDKDGIQDSEDACPTEAGPKEFNGCPDRDGDKIIDLKDDCPDDPGPAEFNGCPDTDGDKIIDKNDECPEIPGIELFKGCPDTDGDGLKDSEDLCPEHPGPLVNQGCPDTDNDGIFDYLDGCPEEAGPEENNGCPWPDTDGDGLLDKDDKCPYNAGPVENQGCPYIDTDGDGVLDKDDDCVNVPGPVENKGCPKIDEEIIKRAFDNLEFQSAKAIIKEVSYESLADLATYMVDNPDFKITIAGHTDSDGGEQANMILSKKRAEAVRDFLESRGVAKERATVMWYGESQPLVPNDSPENKQKNRRVEMKIIFE